jgi:hypothetical protein
MTFFQMAVLLLLGLNVLIMYYMLRRLAIATLTGSFMVAHWLNPVRAAWFKETYPCDNDDKQWDKLAEENTECAAGREALIAGAFAAYKECRKIPEKYGHVR